MLDANHLIPSNLERRASVDSRGGCQADSRHRGEGLLSEKIAGGEKRDCGFFAILRNNSEFGPAALKIKDGVRLIPLSEKGLPRLPLDNSSTKSGVRKKGGWIEGRVVLINYWHMTTLSAVWMGLWTAVL